MLSLSDLESMQGVVAMQLAKTKINDGLDIVSFLAESGIFPSKGEARKTLQGGGVSINRKKIADAALKIDQSYLLHDRYIMPCAFATQLKSRKNNIKVRVNNRTG